MAVKGRMNITLGADEIELLHSLAEETGVPAASIVARIFSAHVPELWEYDTWIKQQQAGTRERGLGVNLMVSFGPESLIAGIKHITPGYQTQGEKFLAGLKKSATDGDAE
ncbi:hypothetical protein CBM2637_A70111 [Cupriavidus taiwanensis]|uniref:hypothetical protein n=1 Tax=Cupriavidus taiwanensis TaxID=164546 RepID=UPI000E133436|nr:hypothetical protein [Cupriavidus taiwanensis]SPA28927.1 hypothetical protein CBM2637_A70111 [Cupriavidus taiwanensis]